MYWESPSQSRWPWQPLCRKAEVNTPGGKMALALGGSHRDEDTLSDWEGFRLFLTLLLLWQWDFGPRPQVNGPTLTSVESSCPSSCYCQLVGRVLPPQGAWVRTGVFGHPGDVCLVCTCLLLRFLRAGLWSNVRCNRTGWFACDLGLSSCWLPSHSVGAGRRHGSVSQRDFRLGMKDWANRLGSLSVFKGHVANRKRRQRKKDAEGSKGPAVCSDDSCVPGCSLRGSSS